MGSGERYPIASNFAVKCAQGVIVVLSLPLQKGDKLTSKYIIQTIIIYAVQ